MAAIRGTNGLPAFSMSSSKKHRGAADRPRASPRETQRAFLAPEQAAEPSLGIARDPITIPVAADEEHRDRLAEDFRIGAQKRRDFHLFLFRKDVGCKRPRRELLGRIPTCARHVELITAGCCVH